MGNTNIEANATGPLKLEDIMSWRAQGERRTCITTEQEDPLTGEMISHESCETETVFTSNCQVEFYLSRGTFNKRCGEHIYTGGGQDPSPVLDASPGCLLIKQGGIPPQVPIGDIDTSETSSIEVVGSEGLDIVWPTIADQTLNDASVIEDLSSYFYNFIVSLAGIIVFGSLVFAGFQYLTSAGDSGKMSQAKSRINSAFLGLLFIFVSFIILNTINPQLTTFPSLNTADLGNILALHPSVRNSSDQPPCTSIIFYNLSNYGIDKDGKTSGDLISVTLSVPPLDSSASPRRLIQSSIDTDPGEGGGGHAH